MLDFTKLPDWQRTDIGEVGRIGFRKNGGSIEIWIKHNNEMICYSCLRGALQRFINDHECEDIVLGATRKEEKFRLFRIKNI
mgnify:FL=1